MKHNDEELKEIGIPDPASVEREYIGTGGKSVEKLDHAFAYRAIIDGTPTHFIKYSRGELADPYNATISKTLSKHLSSFKKVTADTYKNYVKFLETRNTLYFTRARRNLM